MSKRKQAIELARANPGMERTDFISLLQTELGLGFATANSYASSVRTLVLGEQNTAAAQAALEAARASETDEEIEARLRERFLAIEILTDGACEGELGAVIISGPPSFGKSHLTKQALAKYDPEGTKTILVKGTVRATGLYLLLYKYRHEGCVIVFDDADGVFRDEDSLNLLKAALDSDEERIISWLAETRMVDEDGEPIERSFEFKATAIFLSNKDFDAEIASDNKMSPHFEALLSRAHYIECDMHSRRDYLIRIKMICDDGMLRDRKDMTHTQSDLIVKYIFDHQDALRELTPRMALKLADLYNLSKGNMEHFHTLAKTSCHKRGI